MMFSFNFEMLKFYELNLDVMKNNEYGLFAI